MSEKERHKHCGLGRCNKNHEGITCNPDGIPCEHYIPPPKSKKSETKSQTIAQLRTDLAAAEKFEVAVKKRHNGYDSNNELCSEPESPEQALQDLQDEWDKIEDDYATQIVEAQADLKRHKEALEWIIREAKSRDEISKVLRLNRIQDVADQALNPKEKPK